MYFQNTLPLFFILLFFSPNSFLLFIPHLGTSFPLYSTSSIVISLFFQGRSNNAGKAGEEGGSCRRKRRNQREIGSRQQAAKIQPPNSSISSSYDPQFKFQKTGSTAALLNFPLLVKLFPVYTIVQLVSKGMVIYKDRATLKVNCAPILKVLKW